MNLRTALRLPSITFCVFSFLLSNFHFPPQAAAAPSADLHEFFGQVTAVNLAARTITIQLGKSFVFHITAETRISSAAGGAVPFEKIQIGDGAFVTMRTGPGNIGIAVKILLTSAVTFPADYSARTTKGETISGAALSNYVVYQPPREDINRGLNFGMTRAGLFLLSVQPDGTVATVKPLRSLGYEELDARAIKYLKKWRFRPNSVTEVRMPIGYQRTR
jgi:TonB family protein